jgi:hypothetical protein
MSALELRLPTMPMGIDEAWADDLVGAIDGFDSLGRRNLRRNSFNPAIFYKYIGSGRDYMVVRVMNQGDTALKQKNVRCHCKGCKIQE